MSARSAVHCALAARSSSNARRLHQEKLPQAVFDNYTAVEAGQYMRATWTNRTAKDALKVTVLPSVTIADRRRWANMVFDVRFLKNPLG